MDNFFKHYPLIRYGNTVSNTVAVNIFAKIAFQKSIQQNFETFHPYTIKEGDRADSLPSQSLCTRTTFKNGGIPSGEEFHG